jgi:hypothetical protein
LSQRLFPWNGLNNTGIQFFRAVRDLHVPGVVGILIGFFIETVQDPMA